MQITRLWQAEAGLFYGDINFYFNPVTCLLEPIGFDSNPKREIKSPYCYFTWGDIEDNWVNFALKDPTVASAYIASLHQYASLPYVADLKNSLSERRSFQKSYAKGIALEVTGDYLEKPPQFNEIQALENPSERANQY